MTSAQDAPDCAFYRDQRWHWGHASKRLRLPLSQLSQLPEYLANAGARWACGLLPYEAGEQLHGLDSSQQEPYIEVLLFEQLQQGEKLPTPRQPFTLTQPFQCDTSEADYQQRFARIQHYLKAGDCYQVNLAMRFQGQFSGASYSGWHRLVQQHPAPHACYFKGRESDLMSVSPERFLAITDGNVRTDPIKGSQPRGQTPEEDARLGQQLQQSDKDRAENLMIVDLLRNDLGAICESGSLKVEPLFALERFSNVQHLVSTIQGRLRADINPIDALLACFPGGSITGAPKRRAMEIIKELEPQPRGAYCGSFFTLERNGHLNANILIRSFQAHRQSGQVTCHGGGGITIASTQASEYQECHFKVAKLMAALVDAV